MKILKIAKLIGATTLVSLSLSPAHAGIVFSATPGSATYAGPTPLFDFSGPTPYTGGSIVSGTVPTVHTSPLGGTGNYAASGPANGNPGILDFSAVPGNLTSISFIWGSVDGFNTLRVLSASNAILASITGTQLLTLVGPGTNAQRLNPIVKLTFTGADIGLVKKLSFASAANAFEIDNVSVTAVPEPATWAFMIFGFGAIGAAMRRRRQSRTLKLA